MLTKFDIQYKQRIAIKGKSLAHFVAKLIIGGPCYLIKKSKVLEAGPFIPTWTLYIDGFTNQLGCGVGLVLIKPNNVTIEYALRFGFQTLTTFQSMRLYLLV